MARYTDETPITAAAMREYADALEQLAQAHRTYAEWMEKAAIHPLHVTNFKSATQAIDTLLGFLGACGKAIAETLMNGRSTELPALFAAASKEPVVRARLLALRNRREQFLSKILEQDKIDDAADAAADALLAARAPADAGQIAGHSKRGGKPKS